MDQSRDDYTDWVKFEIVIQNLNYVVKILGK